MLFGDLVGKFDKVELPSQEIQQYLHVYQPLVELQVNIEHPESGQKYTDMVSQKTFQGQEIKVVTI